MTGFDAAETRRAATTFARESLLIIDVRMRKGSGQGGWCCNTSGRRGARKGIARTQEAGPGLRRLRR